MTEIRKKVRAYFEGLDGAPTDTEFHAWAEKNGIATDKAEAAAYACMFDMIHPPAVDEKKEGRKVEREHADLIKKIRKDIEKDGKLDLTDDQVYDVIAAAHLKEQKNYYAKLLALVETENGKAMKKSMSDRMEARRTARRLYQGSAK
jgi:uncharacterized protein YpuA (DUF1002 family)